MSLFPSASFDANSSKRPDDVEKVCSKEWLKNASFKSDAAATLHKINKEKVEETIATSIQAERAKKRHLSLKEESSSSESEDEAVKSPLVEGKQNFKDVMFLDKSCDKNNLYFGKPYKVHIPKFYRSSLTCMGLPPWLKIVFKEDRKRKKKPKLEERYFHFRSPATLEEVDHSDETTTEVENLNVKTRENPQDIHAWMQLVNLQDKIPCKLVKLVAEKKISILDKAIAANPRNTELKLTRLKLLESISQDTDRDWKNFVFQHPESRTSWEAYISHTMTLNTFTIHRSLKVFEKCLQTLSAIRNQTVHTEDFKKRVEDDMIIIFEQLVQFLMESGLTECVITILLILLEINVRSNQCSDLLDVERFYKSGDPILGEVKSLGWNTWFHKHERGGWKSSVAVETNDEEDEIDVDFDKSINENWLMMESKRGISNLLPWRSEEDCEDLARKVSYDEIKGFLFLIENFENKIKLVKIFIHVIGVNTEANNRTPFMLTQPCQITHACRCNDVMGDIPSIGDIICSGSTCRYGVLPRKPHHQLVCLVSEQIISICPDYVRSPVGVVSLSYFISRLSRLRNREKFKQEVKKTGKEARKFAKTLLKGDPLNFLLWTQLAEVEFLAGNTEECQKIFHNALCMSEKQKDAFLLCRKYSQLLFKVDDESLKRILIALGDSQTFKAYLQERKELSGAVQLRATRSLERLIEELGCIYQQVTTVQAGELSLYANVVYCYSVYVTITSHTAVEPTLRKCIDVLREEKRTGNALQASTDLRSIHTLKINLTSQDCQRSSAYRNAVLSALDDFPDCPQFALKLCEIEVGSSLSSIARRLFAPMTNELVAFFALYFEMLRLERAGDKNSPSPVTPRALHLLERAITIHDKSGLLWRIYARFSKNPKDVLTRASAACPWSKAIACDRLRMGADNIDDVIKFMQDKGIRVRTPVEEVRLLLAV